MKNYTDIVQAQLEAYNRCDLETFCECYHPEVVVKLLMEDRILIQGINEFTLSYEKLFKLHPGQVCHLQSRIGRVTHPEGLRAVAIYGFRENLIDRVWFI